MKRVLVAAALCSGVLIPSAALAAPAPTCTPATVTPQAAVIPANLPAFGYTALAATTVDIHLVAKGATRTAVPLTLGRTVDGYLEVKPSMPLTPGTAYQLYFDAFCMYGAYPSTPLDFVAGPEAPLPTKLGDATSGPTVNLREQYGTTQVQIDATYTLADEMKPWASVYELAVAFDGKIVETHPSVDANSVTLTATATCDYASSALTKHTIQLQGHLPFAPPVAAASSTLAFTCPAPRAYTPPIDPSPPSSSSSSSGSSGEGDPSQPRRKTVSGCTTTSVSVADASSPIASIGLLFGLALLTRRRVTRGAASAGSRRT